MDNLVLKFQEYNLWRSGLVSALQRYSAWLHSVQLNDNESAQRMKWAVERLEDEKFSIAFVAEFSRGKSELINAIFFAEYGQRVLPAAAGRTTMCPTELMHDQNNPPCIRLLPIETRSEARSTSDYKQQPEAWTVLPLNVNSPEDMLEAFRQVSLTIRVSVTEAQRYGLYDESDESSTLLHDADGMVEISRWRHAIINFPHPLLKQGLVIIDTPGLNAIGTEPELTLNLIPHADAVLFILAADTGVTRSDIAVWRDHIGGGAGRMVVLNKIDSMWDELRKPAEIEAQIAGQAESVARTLGVPPGMVFPVSAQKGLVAKVSNDVKLLARSRLPLLELALSDHLLPSKREVMHAQLSPDIEKIMSAKQTLMATRIRHVVDQLVELRRLRGKNRLMISHMVKRIIAEKKTFDQSLLALQGTRAVFARLAAEVFTHLGMDTLKKEILTVRSAMEESKFSVSLNDAVRVFFFRIGRNLESSSKKTDEIANTIAVMYRKFATEHGFTLPPPLAFSTEKYRKSIALIEQVYQVQFGATAMLRMSKKVVMQKFFDTIEAAIRRIFLLANRDMENWLKAIMSPLEIQIREYKEQLRKRKHTLERISEVSGDLEQKIEALEQLQEELEQQRRSLLALEGQIRSALTAGLGRFRVAA